MQTTEAEDDGVELKMPDPLVDVFTDKPGEEIDVRGAYGGRGSGKTRTFAKVALIKTYYFDQAGMSGIILCGRQFMNSLDDSSLLELKLALEDEDMEWLRPHFDVGEKYIRTKSGRINFVFTGLDRNLGSVKGKSRILLCWVDEAEYVTEPAWVILIPTIREDESELWVTWNPASKRSATHKRYRVDIEPERMKIVELNWRDNPWFPKKLMRERKSDMQKRPDQYAHIWEGDFQTENIGAYYAKHIRRARKEKRIGRVGPDPLMTTFAFWDIGGTGAKADACAIWIVQRIGKEIRWLNHYEAVGQPLSTHVQWLRSNGYGNAHCVLPHDGATNDKVYDVSYESALREAQFEVTVVPNQGKGAAMMRVEALRRLFPSCWFNEETTEAGIEALGWYHEKRDEERDVGLGPNHDWSSHSSDAAGLAAVFFELPEQTTEEPTFERRKVV